MHFLHRVLADDRELAGQVERLGDMTAGNSLVSGLLLDINPLWLEVYRAWEAGLDVDRVWPSARRRAWWDALVLPGSAGGPPELDKRFDSVQRALNGLFRQRLADDFQPFLLRISVLPSAEEPAERSRLLRQVRAIAAEMRVPTVIETRAAPRLLASPGDAVHSASGLRGTLGGYLVDKASGHSFAVTCGHAVSPGPVTSTAGQAVGQCVHCAVPAPLPPGVLCRPHCGAVTHLDVALIAHGGPHTPSASKVSDVYKGDIVEMTGATSGHRHFQIGAAVVWHPIGDACWSGLHELVPLVGGISPLCFKLMFNPPPKPGDSGAWLLKHGSEWTGMLVASDHYCGYALASDGIIRQANMRFGLDLAV